MSTRRANFSDNMAAASCATAALGDNATSVSSRSIVRQLCTAIMTTVANASAKMMP